MDDIKFRNFQFIDCWEGDSHHPNVSFELSFDGNEWVEWIEWVNADDEDEYLCYRQNSNVRINGDFTEQQEIDIFRAIDKFLSEYLETSRG
jgi:hypothetical protein